MSFWNYLGLACLFDTLFGGNKRTKSDAYTQSYTPLHETELDDRFDSLSERLDELESRLDDMNPDTELYDDLYDDIELLRDELDEIEDERDDVDDY